MEFRVYNAPSGLTEQITWPVGQISTTKHIVLEDERETESLGGLCPSEITRTVLYIDDFTDSPEGEITVAIVTGVEESNILLKFRPSDLQEVAQKIVEALSTRKAKGT